MAEYTNEEFETSYNKIYDMITKDGAVKQQNCVIFLGGQPGAGKSHIIDENDCIDYVKINGDDYRKYHPHFDEITSYDIENMPTRTQEFVNKCYKYISAKAQACMRKGLDIRIHGEIIYFFVRHGSKGSPEAQYDLVNVYGLPNNLKESTVKAQKRKRKQ